MMRALLISLEALGNCKNFLSCIILQTVSDKVTVTSTVVFGE